MFVVYFTLSWRSGVAIHILYIYYIYYYNYMLVMCDGVLVCRGAGCGPAE